MEIGYVVIEFNQASGQPEALGGDVFYSRDVAEDVAEQCREEAARVGRRERYAVGTVTIEEED